MNLKVSQMKKTYKFLAVIAVLAIVAIGVSSCKTGCGCPKFEMEQSNPLQ